MIKFNSTAMSMFLDHERQEITDHVELNAFPLINRCGTVSVETATDKDGAILSDNLWLTHKVDGRRYLIGELPLSDN